MIREAIDFYREKLENVDGVGKVVHYFRGSKNQSKTIDLFKSDSGKIDCVVINPLSIGPFAVSDEGPKMKAVTLTVTLIKQFEDSSDYEMSSQKDFDTTMENLFLAFDTHQKGTYLGETSFTILPIDSEIEVLGDDGIANFLGSACHVAQYDQVLVTS